MSRKPESTFIASVHRHLPPELHREKMCNPYSSGTADVWYSGNHADLWVEYKFIPKIPVRDNTLIVPELSALQLEWLEGRHGEGRNVALIIGCPEGGVLYRNGGWRSPCQAGYFRKALKDRKTLADWIVKATVR